MFCWERSSSETVSLLNFFFFADSGQLFIIIKVFYRFTVSTTTELMPISAVKLQILLDSWIFRWNFELTWEIAYCLKKTPQKNFFAELLIRRIFKNSSFLCTKLKELCANYRVSEEKISCLTFFSDFCSGLHRKAACHGLSLPEIAVSFFWNPAKTIFIEGIFFFMKTQNWRAIFKRVFFIDFIFKQSSHQEKIQLFANPITKKRER